MNTLDLLAELRQARARLTNEHRAELLAAGVPANIINLYPLIGVDAISVGDGLYQPTPGGGAAYITPVLVNGGTPETPHPLAYARHLGECVDLVAWHPLHPERWALRTGAATWLGCIGPQYMDPEPVAIRRSPLAWLRAACDGLVILSKQADDAYRLLCGCAELIAEDAEHRAELRKLTRRPWPLPRIVEQLDAA